MVLWGLGNSCFDSSFGLMAWGYLGLGEASCLFRGFGLDLARKLEVITGNLIGEDAIAAFYLGDRHETERKS